MNDKAPPPVPARTDDGTTNPHPLPTTQLQIPTAADEASATFELQQRQASLMSRDPFLPEQLKGRKVGQQFKPFDAEQVVAICYRVCRQAERWQMDAYAVAQEAYPIGGKLAYQGKVFGALANSLGGLAKPLAYSFTGEGDQREVTVEGVLPDGEVLSVTLTKKQAMPTHGKPNVMWQTDVDQKLCYSGAIRWCRRHRPELVMGCHAVEEVCEPESARPVRVIQDQVERLEAVASEVMDGSASNGVADAVAGSGELFERAPTEQEQAQ